MICPRCGAHLTSEEIFEILASQISRIVAECPHTNTEDHPTDPTVQICEDCGTIVETRRLV